MKRLLERIRRSLGRVYCVFYGVLFLLGAVGLLLTVTMLPEYGAVGATGGLIALCCAIVLFVAATDEYE